VDTRERDFLFSFLNEVLHTSICDRTILSPPSVSEQLRQNNTKKQIHQMIKKIKHFSRDDTWRLIDLIGIVGTLLVFVWWIYQRWIRRPKVVETVENQENNNSNRRIVLLGDSILDNRMYVSSGKSVADLLQKALVDKGYVVELFAVDGATIRDVEAQCNQLPMEYNTPETVLVLSVGGNDFLSGLDYGAAEVEYVRLLERIRELFGSCKMYLVNLYQPVDPLFAIFSRIIDKWNLFLQGIVEKGGADGVVDVFSVINGPEDLVWKIEPSAVGGGKIAAAIVDRVVG
jgi:hypothetical protein